MHAGPERGRDGRFPDARGRPARVHAPRTRSRCSSRPRMPDAVFEGQYGVTGPGVRQHPARVHQVTSRADSCRAGTARLARAADCRHAAATTQHRSSPGSCRRARNLGFLLAKASPALERGACRSASQLTASPRCDRRTDQILIPLYEEDGLRIGELDAASPPFQTGDDGADTPARKGRPGRAGLRPRRRARSRDLADAAGSGVRADRRSGAHRTRRGGGGATHAAGARCRAECPPRIGRCRPIQN